ncbi:MAG: SulP family inorganic anion transporter [Bacteroidota bacterium]
MDNKTKSFSLASLKSDLPAGLVVFFVALPLCMGIALASGAPMLAGLISGIIGGIVVGFISNSQVSVSGPAAGLAVIVFTAIQTLQSFELFLVAVIIGGVFQIILGLIKAGTISTYFPSSVIKGMLAAIGIILILKQIPHAVGYDADYFGNQNFASSDGKNTFSEIFYSIIEFTSLTEGAVLISIVSLFLLIIGEIKSVKKLKIFKLLPVSLIVVVVGTLMNEMFNAYFPVMRLSLNHMVSIPPSQGMQDFLDLFSFPDFNALTNIKTYEVAITLAIVASLESLLSIEATDKIDTEKRHTNTNRELIAQGSGNILAGFLGGLPITAVIVRSSANINAGGKTKLSAILHGFLLLIAILFFAKLLNKIPLSCLASILLVVGYKLAKVELFKNMFKLGWDQFLPFIVTVVAIVLTDMLKGIGIGIVVSFFFILRNNYRVHFDLKKRKEGNTEVFNIKLGEEVSFLNKGVLFNTLNKIPNNSVVLIDGTNSKYIDNDVLEIIQNFKHDAEKKNINLSLHNIKTIEVFDAH